MDQHIVVYPYNGILFSHKKEWSSFFFLAAFGLSCCMRGLLFIVACGLLIVVASLVVEHGL